MSERHHEWLQLALDVAQVGTWSWSLDTNEVSWSGQVESIFGLPEDEIGDTYEAFLNLVHPDDRDHVEQCIEAALHGTAHLCEIEHRIVRPDGTVRWVEDRGQVIQAPDGSPTRMVGTVADITERKECERELQRSKRLFDAVFDDPKMLVGLADPDGTVRHVNQTALDLVDANRDDVVGKIAWETPWWSYSEEVQADLQQWTERAAAGEYVAFEVDHYGPEGERHTVNSTIRPVTNDEGEVVSLIMSGRDVTEHKEAERELREREQRLKRYKRYTDDVLDAIDDIFYVISEDHHFQRWNASFRALVGYSDEEIASMSPLELFGTEDDKTAIEEALKEVFETGSKCVEAELVTKDGTSVSYEFVSSKLEDPDGNTVEVGIGRDISERKEAEEKLRASKEYAEGLIASMQDGFSVIDTEMRQVQVNEALCRMTGFSREELVDVDPPYPYWPPEERETIQSAFEKTIEQRQFESLELVFKQKSGARFPVLVTPSQLTNEAGEVVNYFSTMKDITERKRAEEALKQSEARLRTLVEDLRAVPMRLLEAQEQERRRIARELHDEAGGLLTSLQMCLDTAIRYIPAEDNDGTAVAHEELQEAQELTSTLSTQVRQMALNLRPSVLDDLGLAAALQSLADWYAKHAGLTIRLYHEIEEGQRFAEAVETAAYRIVQEALTNASRYAAVEEVQVMVNVLEEHLRIHVIDEGRGFDLERVQQAHETVGLSSMRERAELLEGALEIATAPGEGTRISATLPTNLQ